MHGPYTLIANAKAGKRDKTRLEQLRHLLAERLDGPLTYVPVRSGEEIAAATRTARELGRGTVFAAGGDGTLSSIAEALKGSEVLMAPLPMGTFNFFTRGLNLPEDPEAAIAALIGGNAHPCPVGTVNGRVFLNNASLGLYPSILAARESIYDTWGRSRLAAYWSVVKTLLKPGHRMRIALTVDGERQEIRTRMVFIGSNPYQLDHFRLTGSALPQQGKLALFYGPDQGRFGLLKTAFFVAIGKARKDREFVMLSGSEITLGLKRRRVTVAIDGERMRFEPPLTLRLTDALLRVQVPKGAGPSEARAA